MSHRVFGPLIEDWQENRAIRPKAKRLATASILAVPLITLLMGYSSKVLIIQIVVLSAVLTFIWSRPNG
jgi:uncharacterized membrane protein YbaN (DUF454 family)